MRPSEYFDIVAPLYDRLVKPSDPDRLKPYLHLPTTGLLLDAGGGTGRSSYELRSSVKAVIIADSSIGMLNKAAEKGGFFPVCTFSEGLPFKEGAFARIIMVDALHHVKDQRTTLSELWRVLEPGGLLVIEEPDSGKFLIRLFAVFEKLLLMRSHILSPRKILESFNHPNAKVEVISKGVIVWIVIKKIIS